MTAASHCLSLAQKALAAARQAELDMTGHRANDFDRMAIHCAIEYLERTVEELSCFAPAPTSYRTAAKK
jgi:hypothetical protein